MFYRTGRGFFQRKAEYKVKCSINPETDASINRVTETFATLDYVVFALSLALSALIGIYFAWVDRHKTADEYMMGGRSVGPIPIVKG